MKYKQGGGWLAGTVIGYIIFAILDYVKPQVVDTILNIQGNSLLLLINLIFLGLAGFGVFLILKEKYGWFKKSNEQQEKSKYDPKFLNDTVFRKLMRVDCFYNIFLFGKRLWFGIPTDERAFQNKDGGNYSMWIMESIDVPYDQLYNSIESTIPNLAIGEKHLEQNYNDIYKDWIQIKQTVIDHNKKYDDFVNHLSTIAEQKISESFPTFFSNTKVKEDFDGDVYFLKEIKETLSNAIEHNCQIEREESTSDKKINLDSLFVAKSHVGEYWVLYSRQINGKVLMASSDKNKLDVKKLQPILCSIINDLKNTELFINSKQYDYSSLRDKIEKFTERLEKEVVHDIDAMITSS